jgi:hypothetical protein
MLVKPHDGRSPEAGLELPFIPATSLRFSRGEGDSTFETRRFSRVLNKPQVVDDAGESAARLKHGFESRWDHQRETQEKAPVRGAFLVSAGCGPEAANGGK